MSIRDERQRAVLERMADHLLREGMAGASLRPLAAAAGTSNRMLLYYFADKDELLAATLEHLAARLARLLDEAGPGDGAPHPFPALLAEVWAAVRAPGLRPYMHLWLELAAGAARGQEPHRTVAGRIADGFLAWAAARLEVEREADRAPRATLLLAAVDGLALLDAVGRSAAAGEAVGAAADLTYPRTR